MNEKVSVIIPLYNGEKYINQAIESVLEQTYTNYEIIVVDDGSTDNSKQILSPYFDKIKYIYQKNQGVAAARNKGLEIATGDYIAFLDQDDYWLENKLERQINCFQSLPQISIIHSGWYRVNENNQIKGKIEPWNQVPLLDLKNWLWWKPVLLGAMMFRRRDILQVGGLDTNFKQVCDLELVLNLTLAGYKTTWLKEITLFYREHDRNDSLNTRVQAEESIQVLDKFFSAPNLSIQIKQWEKECRYYTLIWCAWRLYYTGYLQEMTLYLHKSWQYKTNSPTETVINWMECLRTFAQEYNQKIDFYQLTNTPEWKSLITELFSVKSPVL
jgi:glycosyltransferase involved in cell wall biosynthesis